MQSYYRGFAINNDRELLHEWIPTSQRTVTGFSMGAQSAIEAVYSCQNDIDRVVLISPAFFNDRGGDFAAAQLAAFDSNKEIYLRQFVKNAAYPSKTALQIGEAWRQELEELLNYRWDTAKLEALRKKGVAIEVILGERDRIVDSVSAKKFFIPFATIFIVNGAGHILQKEERIK